MSLKSILRCSTWSLLAVAANACGDNAVAPAEMRHIEGTTSVRTEIIAKGDLIKRTNNLHQDVSVTKKITYRGGQITIREAGLVVDIPRYALSEDVEITVTAHRGNRVVYSFAPHGLVFNQPISIAQNLRDTELSTPRGIKRVDAFGGYLPEGLANVDTAGVGSFSEVLPGVYTGKGKDYFSSFQTTHFSGYALASGRRDTSNDGY